MLYMIRKKDKMNRIGPRWAFGVSVGAQRKSNDLMVATPLGVYFVRAVRRIFQEKRLGEDCVKWVAWAPWKRCKDAAGGDDEVPDGSPRGGIWAAADGLREDPRGCMWR